MSVQSYIAPDVYFPLEIVTREYAGQLLLATELASRGRTAVIGHKGRVAEAMRAADRGGLLFYKHASFPSWADERHAQVGQDPESGISILDYADFYAEGRTNLTGSRTRGQFCFGPDEYDFLRSKHPDFTDRIFLTGSPRVSLWGRAGGGYHAEAVVAIKARYGSFVLFASAAGGFGHESVYAAAGLTNDETADVWNQQSSGQHFFSCAKRAAEALDVPVIIRPHPFESWNAWNNLVEPVDNLYLENAFELAAWTRSALAVAHPGESTAALEAVVAGRPAISTGSYDSSLALPISHIATNPDHLVELLHGAVAGGLPRFVSAEARALVQRKVLHPIEGAAQRIADVLDQILPADGPSGLERERSTLRNRARAFTSGTRSRTVDDESQLGRTQPTAYKRPALTLSRVRRDVECLASTLGTTQPISVSQYAPNCFVLRR